MSLLDVLVSGGTGGILGFAGSIAQGVIALKQKKMDNDFALKKADKDLARDNLALEATIKEGEFAIKRTEMETEAQVAVAEAAREAQISADEAKMVVASIKADTATYSTDVQTSKLKFLLIIVDFIRGVTRPILAFGVLALMWNVTTQYQNVLEPDFIARLASFMTMTVLTFYFGGRGMDKMLKLNK